MTKHTNVTATIEAVTALLARPEAWCQKASARDAAGQPVPPESPEACSWCLLGAVARVSGDEAVEAVEKRLVHVCRTELGLKAALCIGPFNDAYSTEHADILDLLRRCRRAA